MQRKAPNLLSVTYSPLLSTISKDEDSEQEWRGGRGEKRRREEEERGGDGINYLLTECREGRFSGSFKMWRFDASYLCWTRYSSSLPLSLPSPLPPFPPFLSPRIEWLLTLCSCGDSWVHPRKTSPTLSQLPKSIVFFWFCYSFHFILCFFSLILFYPSLYLSEIN